VIDLLSAYSEEEYSFDVIPDAKKNLHASFVLINFDHCDGARS
jgi:hypothetical protein